MTPEALASLHARGFTSGRPWQAAEFRDLLSEPHTRLSVRPEGFALWRSIAGEAELLTIVVEPDARRRGIGTALMTAWMADAANSADTAFLEVARDNAPAIALYEKFGFEPVGSRKNYYRQSDGMAVDALLMRAAFPKGHAGESPIAAPKSG